MPKAPPSVQLESTYVQLDDDGVARLLPVTDSFWPELMAGRRPDVERGRMVSMYQFAENWPSWERHPAGDELVVLVSGTAELLLEQAAGVTRAKLHRPGEFVLVPRNTWHTAHTQGCTMLFVTAGRGTEHRPA
jgi:quercetin dioxygenase-like cupin family protein